MLPVIAAIFIEQGQFLLHEFIEVKMFEDNLSVIRTSKPSFPLRKGLTIVMVINASRLM